MYWYENDAAPFSPVLSTRVRFARNLEGVPFPRRLTKEGKEKVWEEAAQAYEGLCPVKVPFASLSPLEKRTYVDTRLASADLLSEDRGAGLLLSRDGEVAIMVNEEDHLRIQAIESGDNLKRAKEAAVKAAKYGEERLAFAFREKLGYLTSCPTNLGAACRISVMIHLPALHALSAMPGLIQRLNNAGFTVRGAFGEGSRAGGGIYQISNQMSRDKDVEAIALAFEEMLSQVRERESAAREKILSRQKTKIEDRICRAVGVLLHARKMDYGEFCELFSLVRFGKALGLDEARDLTLPDRLLIQLAPAPMALSDASLQDADARDLARSERIREENKKKE